MKNFSKVFSVLTLPAPLLAFLEPILITPIRDINGLHVTQSEDQLCLPLSQYLIYI